MPGINQLKQFDNDILPIGDEPEIRRKNGTTMPEFAVPENLPEGDDSLDFEFGLPQREEEAGENASGDEGASDAARDKTESDAGERGLPLPGRSALPPSPSPLCLATDQREKTKAAGALVARESPTVDTKKSRPASLC